MLTTLYIIIKGNYIIKLPIAPKTANIDNIALIPVIISILRGFYTVFTIYQYRHMQYTGFEAKKFLKEPSEPCQAFVSRISYLESCVFHFTNSINNIGKNIAGSILPTFTFFISRMFMPIPIRRTPPTAVISVITASLRYGATDEASRTMEP